MEKLVEIRVKVDRIAYRRLERISRALQRRGTVITVNDLINEGIRYVISYYYKILKFKELYPELFPQ